MKDIKPTQVKLFDLTMTHADTEKKETLKSDIYDILAMEENLLRIRNTVTGEDIVVSEDMVEKFFYGDGK
jgi:hypothetical protein